MPLLSSAGDICSHGQGSEALHSSFTFATEESGILHQHRTDALSFSKHLEL